MEALKLEKQNLYRVFSSTTFFEFIHSQWSILSEFSHEVPYTAYSYYINIL